MAPEWQLCNHNWPKYDNCENIIGACMTIVIKIGASITIVKS